MRTLTFLTAGAWLALTGCNPDEGGPGGHVAIAVDPSITPTLDTLGTQADGEPRPVAALVDHEGFQVDFVEDELVVASNDVALVAAIAARWGGEVVDTIETEEGTCPTCGSAPT